MSDTPRNTLDQASQPKVPEYLPVIVALNDASFDVLSWPINSVRARLRDQIAEVIYEAERTSSQREYLTELKKVASETFRWDRDVISRQLRSLAALVFEGRPLR